MSNKTSSPDSPATKIDGEMRGIWCTEDSVVSLRERGKELPCQLSLPPAEAILGAAPDCTLQLHDPMGCISRKHVRLRMSADDWLVHDLESTNGVTCDEVRLSSS